jgi:hypothetical protein
MSFDPRGERLMALLGGRKRPIVWDTRNDPRAVADLRRDAGLLAPAARNGRVLRIADAAEHAYLRAHDPGAWPDALPRPPLNVARRLGEALVPARSAQATPLQLDLTDFYSLTTETFRSAADTVLMNTRGLPVGLVTLDGFDYDIRGGVELRTRPMTGNGEVRPGDVQSAVSGIRVPAVPIAALHVLMLAALPLPEPHEREYARIRLHYRGGGEATLSIRTQRDVPGMTGHDRPTPIGWADNDLVSVGVLPIQTFPNPRLANPHPERIVESLDLEGSEEGWSEPVFIAVTIEPVIARAESGTNKMQGGVK